MMILLESGPAKTDRLYWLIVGLVFLGYGGWCVYDGTVGYYEDNRKKAEAHLQRWTDLPIELDTKLTKERFLAAKEKLKQAPLPTIETVRQELGPPLPRKKGESAPPTAEYFASLYGMATVKLGPGGRVSPDEMTWTDWEHKPHDIRMQFYMAAAVGLLAAYMLYRGYRAATLRAVMDEQGLTYGKTRIAYEDMVALQDYNPKGWVDLYYRTDRGQKRLRIDNQKIAKFDEIADLICQKKGFVNPIKAYAASRERPAEPEQSNAEADRGEDHPAD